MAVVVMKFGGTSVANVERIRNVARHVKREVDGGNAVAGAIALADGAHEFWLHFGDIEIGPPDARRPVRMIENLKTGERHLLEWNGRRLRIDTADDPALLFRCHP